MMRSDAQTNADPLFVIYLIGIDKAKTNLVSLAALTDVNFLSFPGQGKSGRGY